MRHYSEAELDRYRAGKMDFLSHAVCKIHLWNCTGCRSLLEKLEEDELLIADLKLSLSKDQTPENPETYQKLCDHFRAAKDSAI